MARVSLPLESLHFFTSYLGVPIIISLVNCLYAPLCSCYLLLITSHGIEQRNCDLRIRQSVRSDLNHFDLFYGIFLLKRDDTIIKLGHLEGDEDNERVQPQQHRRPRPCDQPED